MLKSQQVRFFSTMRATEKGNYAGNSTPTEVHMPKPLLSCHHMWDILQQRWTYMSDEFNTCPSSIPAALWKPLGHTFSHSAKLKGWGYLWKSHLQGEPGRQQCVIPLTMLLPPASSFSSACFKWKAKTS